MPCCEPSGDFGVLPIVFGRAAACWGACLLPQRKRCFRVHVATWLGGECARQEVYGMIGSCHGLGSTSLAKGDCHGGKVCDLLGKSGCGGLD